MTLTPSQRDTSSYEGCALQLGKKAQEVNLRDQRLLLFCFGFRDQ